jgi:hypothetical protein
MYCSASRSNLFLRSAALSFSRSTRTNSPALLESGVEISVGIDAKVIATAL